MLCSFVDSLVYSLLICLVMGIVAKILEGGMLLVSSRNCMQLVWPINTKRFESYQKANEEI